MAPTPFAVWQARKLALFAFYLLANLAGAILITHYYHSIIQMVPQEKGGYYVDGISFMEFYWKTFPVFSLFFFINALWGIKALIDVFKRRNFRALIALGIAFAVWAADIFALRF